MASRGEACGKKMEVHHSKLEASPTCSQRVNMNNSSEMQKGLCVGSVLYVDAVSMIFLEV